MVKRLTLVAGLCLGAALLISVGRAPEAKGLATKSDEAGRPPAQQPTLASTASVSEVESQGGAPSPREGAGLPCQPDAAGQACDPVQCPVPGETCVPTRVQRFTDGTWKVIECQCLTQGEECHVMFDAAADQVWCEGLCPAPLECTLISSGQPDGTIEFWCECRDPQIPGACEPLAGTPLCAGPCPPNQACKRVGTDAAGFPICDCRGWDECQLFDDGTGNPFCSGPCPSPNDVCQMVGTICDCVPPEPTGACCLGDGSCVETTPTNCQATGGTYAGDGVPCEGDEACCLDGDCVLVDALCCRLQLGGIPQGPGTDCLGDNDNNGIDDACECKATPDGSACLPKVCSPIPEDRCLPICVNYDPNSGQTTILQCECQDWAMCHVDIVAGATPDCIDDCPPPLVCTRSIVNNADGTIDVCCTCDPSCGNGVCESWEDQCTCPQDCGAPPATEVPGSTCTDGIDNDCDGATDCDDPDCATDPACIPVCEPTPGGTGCEPINCPVPPAGDRCLPRCVNYDPLTGMTTVIDCECRGPNDCRVGFVAGPGARDGTGPCVVPDNGSGTVKLPPDGCEYLSPDEVHMVIDDLDPNTTIELAPIHKDFICRKICGDPGDPDPCTLPGGIFGPNGEIECFDSTLELHLEGTGALAGYMRMITIPNVSCLVNTAPRTPGDAVQSFATEMMQLQGELFGDPDFAVLRVRAGMDFGLPSPGHTTLTQQPGGDFSVDSFFDITYEIEFAGAPGTVLDGYAGMTIATIRMQTGTAPTCVGDCPAGEVCVETTVTNPDGTIDLCCDCEPAPQVCEPTPNGDACEPVTCPDSAHVCEPRCVNFDPVTGQITVVDCECRGSDECHVDLGGAAGRGVPGPCVLPDNGGGTVDLPPAGCPYLSPDEVHLIIDGLPAGTTIQLDPIHQDFIVRSRTPGGPLGGEVEVFDSALTLNVSGTGVLTGYNRLLSIPLMCETHTGPRTPGDAVQDFDTDMYLLQGQISGDPDFDLLRFTAGTGNGLPSPGHTTLTQLPGGDFAVDSFFDITYQIDFTGAPGSILDGMSGSTLGTIRMQAGVPIPPCVGGCPANEVCTETIVTNPDGTINVCCDCRPRCICGDLNLSGGPVDLADFVIFAGCFGQPPTTVGCECADLNGDGAIDLADFVIFAGLFGTTPTSSPPNC